MKTLIVSFAAAVALIVPAAAFSDGGLQAPAHVSGTALIVPNNMMCVRGVVCNAYHGQVVFCHSFPGMMATAVPCKTPAATVLTSANGKYSAVVAAGNYNVYVHGVKHPWLIFAGKFTPGADTFNIAISRITG